MSDYFSNTRIYKIWIDIIDIFAPLFSDVLLSKSFAVGDVICNRSGVRFFHSNNDKILEIFFYQPERRLMCSLRTSNGSNVIYDKPISSKEELLVEANSLLEKIKDEL